MQSKGRSKFGAARRTKSPILAILLLFFLIFSLFSPLVEAVPDRQEAQTIIEAYIEEAREGTAAVSIAYFQEGEVLYQTAYGQVDLEEGLANSAQAIFEWGSVSKALVWVSLIQLAEQGLVDLAADIRTYLPADFPLKLKSDEAITLLHLMNHNAGFQEVTARIEYEAGQDLPSLEQALVEAAPPQIYEPGQLVAYSNWGAALAGLIVEKVTGQPFHAYVNEHIFQVLAMDQTSVLPDWSDKPWVSKGRQASKSYYIDSENHESYGLLLSRIALYPAGACAGTFGDFIKFAQEFTKEESLLFRDKSSLDLLRTASLNYSDSDLGRVYHGLWSLDLGRKLLGHAGNTQGFTSSFWFDPLSRTGLAIMTNEAGETHYNYGLLQAIYGPKANPSPEAAPADAGESPDLAGLYYPLRTIDQGQARVSKYVGGLLPLLREESAYKIAFLEGASFRPLAENFYLQEMPNGLAFLNKYQEGKLESFTTDYALLPLPELVMAIFLLLVLVANLLFLISRPLALLVRLKTKRTLRPYQVKAHRSLALAGLLALGFFYCWQNLMPYQFGQTAKICLALLAVVSSLLLAYNLQDQLRARRRGENTRLDLMGSIVSALSILAVFFFDLYKFWI